MAKRIIPVSSGKGGVGKTSLAVNLALSLSRFGKTVLVDLDTGTSSIRGVIDAPVRTDLYHFFKRDEPLQNCITPLPDSYDPQGRFRRFGFIAAPKHMIESIANMDQAARNRLIDAINTLDARFIILDLKAGLDPGVIDFMPHANTGLLVFTPNHPAATLAASDIAKAILFRELRELFHDGSAIYDHFQGIKPDEVNELIDRTEDVYQSSPSNLDGFLRELYERMPGQGFVSVLRHIVHRFQVYYVLNRFDNVETSFKTAVRPLLDNIMRHISLGLKVNNMGWIIESEAYHLSNVNRMPYLLQKQPERMTKNTNKLDQRMEELYRLAGLREPEKKHPGVVMPPDMEKVLSGQLSAMRELFEAKQGETVRENYDYVVDCLRYVFQHKRPSEFGTPRLLKKGELAPLLIAQKLKREAAMRNG